jgi:hypothetical protein
MPGTAARANATDANAPTNAAAVDTRGGNAPGVNTPVPPGASAAPNASAANAAAPNAAVANAPAPAPAPMEAARFSTMPFRLAGLAYDAVSARFLFADRLGHKLFVVGERSNHPSDFVRGESAGFRNVAAVEIDARRGDLWVASSSPADDGGVLYKLQLISGRLLRSFPLSPELTAVKLVDLAVTSGGTALALDAAGNQLLALRPGASALERAMQLDVREPAALAAAEEEGAVYVVHRDGVLRVDLRTRTAAPVTAAKGVALDRLERLRRHGRTLVAVRVDDDGTRRIIRLDLNSTGRPVSRATTLEGAAPVTRPVFITFAGDDVVYLPDESPDDIAAADAPRPSEFVVYRVRLR